jgi:hypothetical protein
MWAGAQRTPSAVAGGDSEADVMRSVVRPQRKVCGVLVAMLQGKSWAPIPSIERW